MDARLADRVSAGQLMPFRENGAASLGPRPQQAGCWFSRYVR